MMILRLDPPENRRIACHDFLHTFAHHTWPTPLSTPMFSHVNSAFQLDLELDLALGHVITISS